MANQTITQLNAAGAITGSELVPIVQNGQTVRTTTGAIAASPSLTQTFLTVNNEPTLNNSRYLTSTGSGIGITDNGAQSTLALSLSTPLQTLDTSGAGLLAKTGSNTVTNRSIAVGGGLAVSNASGAAGNPTINLDGVVLALQNSSGTFLLGRTAGGGIATLQLLGTAGEIDVADGTGPSNPTIGLADNPVLPGTEGVVVPSGTTGQRAGSPTNGEIRYNTSNNILEAYTNNIWGVIPTSTASVTSISQGSGITLTPNPIVGAGTVEVSTNGITDALFRQSAGLSVVGRSANSTGNVADIVAGTDNQVLRRSGTAIGFGAVDLAQSAAITGTLPVGNGGTGLSTYTLGDTVYYSAGTSLTKLGIGSSTYIMTSSGTAPQWTDPATITVGSATTATTATNVAGGAANQIVFNTAAATSSFIVAPTVASTFLKWSGSAFTWDATSVGTVTSVDVSGGTTGLTTSGGPITSSGTITLAGTLAIGNGGSGQTTAQTAMNAFAGATTSGHYLRGNGSNVLMAAIQAGDVPTLNQNTTGSAGSVANSVTFTNTGGATVGTTFDGSAARTIDYSTVGAPSATGTGASGTWGISISGNAATATTATTATNVTGGAAGSLVYQTGAATTSTLALGTQGYVLRAGASAPEWAVIDGGTF